MSTGLILLIVTGLLFLLGFGQRVLDKMRLTDKQALLLIALIIVGGLIPDIPLGSGIHVNLGGAVVPLGICIYLWVRCGTWQERVRSIVASVVTAAAVYAIARFTPDEPETILLDPNYLYGIAAGVIAYIFGRSRRGAFIAGVTGVILADAWQAVELRLSGIEQAVYFGGAGAVDTVVISGLLAVILAEAIGEITERIVRGSNPKDREFAHGEIIRGGKHK